MERIVKENKHKTQTHTHIHTHMRTHGNRRYISEYICAHMGPIIYAHTYAHIDHQHTTHAMRRPGAYTR